MKSLLLMRHAKSSWKDAALSDHDRPLNRRGKHDAPRMGRLLVDLDLVPDCIVTSSAKRAHKTALHVAKQAAFDGEIAIRDELYHAAPHELLEVIKTLPDDAERALVVGHNPGMEDLITLLAGAYEVMPTSAIAHVDAAITGWHEAGQQTASILHVWRVKELDPESDR